MSGQLAPKFCRAARGPSKKARPSMLPPAIPNSVAPARRPYGTWQTSVCAARQFHYFSQVLGLPPRYVNFARVRRVPRPVTSCSFLSVSICVYLWLPAFRPTRAPLPSLPIFSSLFSLFSPSVFICVHLWLPAGLTFSRAPNLRCFRSLERRVRTASDLVL